MMPDFKDPFKNFTMYKIESEKNANRLRNVPEEFMDYPKKKKGPKKVAAEQPRHKSNPFAS